MFGFLRKKTKEEQIDKRVGDVMQVLTNSNDFEFTDLETVLILNNVRRKFHEHLENKKSECYSKSVDFQKKAKEIENALSLFE